MDADSETHEPDELEDLQPAAPPTSSPVPEGPEEPAEDAPPAEKRKRKPRPLESPAREPGKSLFPVSRVQKVLKADKELPMVSREAVLLISFATEEFVKRISEASHRLATRDGRSTVQRKDIASVCRRADEFLFLEELIPLYEPETAGRRKPKALQAKDTADGPRTTTMLDKFVSRPKDAQESGEAGGIESGEDGGAATEDVQMHEDGTMTG